jgi:hypothetical protein
VRPSFIPPRHQRDLRDLTRHRTNFVRERVTLVNRLPTGTTIHWHGMDVPPEMDGPAGLNQAEVEPGEAFVYEFVATNPGSRWYHAHADPANQIALGLYGPLVIEPREAERTYDREQTYILSEWDMELTPDVALGKAPRGPRDQMLRGGELGTDLFLINGKAHESIPRIETAAGERVLIRLMNAGNLPHAIHSHGHSFKIVATDGNPVPEGMELLKDTVLIGPGERYDLELEADNPGVWMLHCHMENHAANGMMTLIEYEGETPTGQTFAIARDDLTKHGLIAGVTGSGKTNTCFGLLERVWAGGSGAPFLVIEPAKAEYRALLNRLPGPPRVYTLGDERFAPLRLNPFEFPCQDAEARIHVQTHIDYLKSVFNAAFALFPPMPYVLETCLHEVYQDRGWNLTTSAIERRLKARDRGREALFPVFPTLQDLYAKIEPVVDRLGYDERIRQDVKAGLKARIGSLLLGGKGLMLNTRRSISTAWLLAAPAILELERIGDDDEKAFLIGLLITAIYEHRVVEGRKPQATGERLQHLLLIEEAHRLLQNVSTRQESEAANPRGKAVESFANMLAEIRAYGQGVLIAEQIPTKLAPDAIKNTNLKILHRTIAADEREIMAGAMNLGEAQARAISALPTGRAAVYAEGADRPYLLRIAAAKGAAAPSARPPTDMEVRKVMLDQHAFDDHVYKPRPGCERCGLWKSNPGRCALIRDLAQTVGETPIYLETYRRYVLSLSEEPAQAVRSYPALAQAVKRAIQPADLEEQREVTLCAVVHSSAEQMEQYGSGYAMPYDALGAVHDTLLAAFAPVVRNFQNDLALLASIEQHIAPAAQRFGELMRKLTARQSGPFAGCVFCQAKCRFGLELRPVARDPVFQEDVTYAIGHSPDAAAMGEELAGIALKAGAVAIETGDPRLAYAAAICFTAQAGAAFAYREESQRKLVRMVRETLATRQGGLP